MNTIEHEVLLTVREAAEALAVSEATARRMIRARELRAVRLGADAGRTLRVPASAVREAASRPAAEEREQ